jgi:hypothetical protein
MSTSPAAWRGSAAKGGRRDRWEGIARDIDTDAAAVAADGNTGNRRDQRKYRRQKSGGSPDPRQTEDLVDDMAGEGCPCRCEMEDQGTRATWSSCREGEEAEAEYLRTGNATAEGEGRPKRTQTTPYWVNYGVHCPGSGLLKQNKAEQNRIEQKTLTLKTNFAWRGPPAVERGTESRKSRQQ